MKMKDILRAARELSKIEVEPPATLWNRIKKQLTERGRDNERSMEDHKRL